MELHRLSENEQAFVECFSRFVNGQMGSAAKVGNALADDHRYLINEKGKVVFAFLERLANDYQKGRYDQRDEWVCRLAAEAIEHLVENRLTMASRLITPVLEEILKSYPLYSQDGKGKDAVCVAIFFIGHVRWFVLEGQPEGNDTTLFTIVCGLHETEYGYTSVNEMESVKVDGSKYGVDEIFQVEQLDGFKPVKLKSIPDEDLQAFLHNME